MTTTQKITKLQSLASTLASFIAKNNDFEVIKELTDAHANIEKAILILEGYKTANAKEQRDLFN